MPRPRTTIRQLSYFVALADTGSFTRAPAFGLIAELLRAAAA